MSSELAMNAYVLLGNALLYVTNHPSEPELIALHPALTELHARLEPLTPSQILAALAELSPDERALLSLACRYCVTELTPDQATAMLGLPREVAQQTVVELKLEWRPAS